MVQKYGYTDGCPACQRLKGMSRDAKSLTGRLGVNHTIACKTRILQKMKEDLIDGHIVEAYQHRQQKGKASGESQMQLSKERTNGEAYNTTMVGDE